MATLMLTIRILSKPYKTVTTPPPNPPSHLTEFCEKDQGLKRCCIDTVFPLHPFVITLGENIVHVTQQQGNIVNHFYQKGN